MTTDRERIAREAQAGEVEHEIGPFAGEAKTTVLEEEGLFARDGWWRLGDEELQTPEGRGDEGSCDAFREGREDEGVDRL